MPSQSSKKPTFGPNLDTSPKSVANIVFSAILSDTNRVMLIDQSRIYQKQQKKAFIMHSLEAH